MADWRVFQSFLPYNFNKLYPKISIFLSLNSICLPKRLSYIIQLFSVPFLVFTSFFGYSQDAKIELALKDSIYRREFAQQKSDEISRYSQYRDNHYLQKLSANSKIIVEDHSIHSTNYYADQIPKEKTFIDLAKEWWLLTLCIVTLFIGFFTWIFSNWEIIVCFVPNILREKLKKWMINKINVL